METLIPVDGGEIWAEDTGGPGLPVVLTNSDWCESSGWDATVGELSGRRRVIRYDNRGYGRSGDPAAPFTHLGDLIAVLDRLSVDRAVFAGHSGGGATAIALALAQPERVAALVLAAPGAPGYPWPQDDPYVIEFGRLFAARDAGGLAELGLATWAAQDPGPAAQAQIRAAVAAFFRRGEFPAEDPPAWPRLGEVGVPSVVVLAGLDYPMVTGCATAIAGRIPGCRTVTVPGADHLLPLRAPRLLADLIESAAGPGEGTGTGAG
jgi:3-oxoadipate enol-lactonase